MKALIIGSMAVMALAACGGGGSSSLLPSTSQALSASAPAPKGIAFIGDSITAGSRLPDNPNGVSDPHAQSATAYPFLVGKSLGERVTNLAIGGENIEWAQRDEVPELDPLTKTVVVYLGTNDITFGHTDLPLVSDAERRMNNLLSAIHTRAPQACIALIGIPHDQFAPYMNTYQDQYDAFLSTLGHPMLDLRDQSWTQDTSNFIPDGVHPNVQGNADLAASVTSFLRASGCL